MSKSSISLKKIKIGRITNEPTDQNDEIPEGVVVEWEKRMSGNVIYNKSARSASVNPAIIVTDTGQKT